MRRRLSTRVAFRSDNAGWGYFAPIWVALPQAFTHLVRAGVLRDLPNLLNQKVGQRQA
jgi:hypothetical protein